jgi:hypothetical protein
VARFLAIQVSGRVGGFGQHHPVALLYLHTKGLEHREQGSGVGAVALKPADQLREVPPQTRYAIGQVGPKVGE